MNRMMTLVPVKIRYEKNSKCILRIFFVYIDYNSLKEKDRGVDRFEDSFFLFAVVQVGCNYCVYFYAVRTDS